MTSVEQTWQHDLRNALRTNAQLEAFFEAPFVQTTYPLFIPLDLAQRIKSAGIHSALGRQFLPQESENNNRGLSDPIGDHAHSPTAQIVHRYHNRLLFFPTSVCPVQCRYCFRKNELHDNDELFKPDFENVRRYISKHPEIEEVIFSGGDPLMLSNKKLAYYLDEFANMGISMVRLHTRMPVITPSRMDEGFQKILLAASKRFDVVSVVIHLNHASEISPELQVMMHELRKLPIHWLSQSVLLKGINDQVSVLKELFLALLKIGVKPYYLHHPDQVRGGMHFWLSIEEGRKIFAALRNQISGHAIPQYVLDIPGGHGKVPLQNPEGHAFKGHLMGKDGDLVPYFLN